jgi:hypothetical protein
MVFGLFILIFGCSQKMAPPLKDISNAKIALANASEAGAERFAPIAFNRAKEHFNNMRVYMDKQEYKKAKYEAQKAHVVARLAYTKTQKAKVEKNLKEFQ